MENTSRVGGTTISEPAQNVGTTSQNIGVNATAAEKFAPIATVLGTHRIDKLNAALDSVGPSTLVVEFDKMLNLLGFNTT